MSNSHRHVRRWCQYVLCSLGALVCVADWGRGQEQIAEPTEERLPGEQRQALMTLIRSLETLHGESNGAVSLWLQAEIEHRSVELARIEAQIRKLEAALREAEPQQELEGKLQVAREQREALTHNLNALMAGRDLFADQRWRSDRASLKAGQKLFVEHVRPLFTKHCQDCHGGDSKEAGLDISRRETLLEGGKTGPAIVPGDAKASLLFGLVAHQREPFMPPLDEKLPQGVIELIAEWINSGAPYAESPRGSSPTQARLTDVPDGSGNAVFERVRPILESQCLVCHGGKFKQVGLDISTRESLLRGSEQHGPVVVLGNSGASLLVKKIQHTHEPGMPYKGKQLSQEEIARIVAWIDAETPYDQALQMPASPEEKTEEKAFLHGSDHWAYRGCLCRS